MFEEVFAVLWCEGFEDGFEATPEIIDGAFTCGAEQGLEFCEGHLDGVHVWAVRRQVKGGDAVGLKSLADRGIFVGAEIIHHDDVAFAKLCAETAFDVIQKDGSVHRTGDHERCDDVLSAQAADEGGCSPMSMRDGADAARTVSGASVKPGHLCVDSGFINKDKPIDINKGLRASPASARGGHIRSVLLGRAQAFF